MVTVPHAHGKKAYQQHPLDNTTGVRLEAVRLTALDTPQCPHPALAIDPEGEVEKPVEAVKRVSFAQNQNAILKLDIYVCKTYHNGSVSFLLITFQRIITTF